MNREDAILLIKLVNVLQPIVPPIYYDQLANNRVITTAMAVANGQVTCTATPVTQPDNNLEG